MPIAIDFGTRAFHLVQGKANKRQVTVKKAVLDELSSGLIQDGIIREFGGTELALKNTLRKYGITERTCHITINGNHIYTRELTVPKGKPRVMDDVVKFELLAAMNTDKEMAISYIRSRDPVVDQPDLARVKATAIQMETAQDYQRLLRNCRLTPAVMDIHPNAVLKVFSGARVNDRALDDKGSALLIDIGGVTSSAYVYNRGDLIYSRILPAGGMDVERLYQQRLEKDPAAQTVPLEALDLSPEGLKADEGLAEAMRPFLATTGDGIQRILQYVSSRLRDEPVGQVYLFGRTALFSGLDQSLQKVLNLPTEVVRLLDNVKMPQGVPIAPYINAIGALIRLT